MKPGKLTALRLVKSVGDDGSGGVGVEDDDGDDDNDD